MGLEAGGNPLGRSMGGPWGVPGWILGFPLPGDHRGSNPKTDLNTSTNWWMVLGKYDRKWIKNNPKSISQAWLQIEKRCRQSAPRSRKWNSNHDYKLTIYCEKCQKVKKITHKNQISQAIFGKKTGVLHPHSDDSSKSRLQIFSTFVKW